MERDQVPLGEDSSVFSMIRLVEQAILKKKLLSTDIQKSRWSESSWWTKCSGGNHKKLHN